jgi:hypothetical protein
MQLATTPNRREQRSASSTARSSSAVHIDVAGALRNPLLTPPQPARETSSCSRLTPSETSTSTEAVAPGSQRGPDTGSIPARLPASFPKTSASTPSKTTSPPRVFGADDPTNAQTSTLIAAIGTSDMSGRPTPRLVGLAGRTRGHAEGAADLRTVVGIAAVVGVSTTGAIDVAGRVTRVPPDEHAEIATNNAPTPRLRTPLRITPRV